MNNYTHAETDFLLKTARRTLETITQHNKGRRLDFDQALFGLVGDFDALPAELREKRAAFVTLEMRPTDDLRGCTGTLEARLPLVHEVIFSAHHTAFYDPRFAPLHAEEVGHLRIEISILTPSEPLPYTDSHDLLSQLRVGEDGVTLSYGNRRATFLPQVWERLSKPTEFLGALCRKMGLPQDTWQQVHMNVEVYSAIKMVEP